MFIIDTTFDELAIGVIGEHTLNTPPPIVEALNPVPKQL